MRGLWLLIWLHLLRVGPIGVSPLDPSDLALCVELWMKSSIGANIRNDVQSPRRFVLGQKDHMKVLRSEYCSSCNSIKTSFCLTGNAEIFQTAKGTRMNMDNGGVRLRG